MSQVTVRHIRCLFPVFWGRFFEHELTGRTAELRNLFFWLLSFLAAPGFLLPFLVAFAGSSSEAGAPDDHHAWGWNLLARYQGTAALRLAVLSDKAFYLGYAMSAAGLVAVVVWSSLIPDGRDLRVLGPLPVRTRTIVLSRLLALMSYVLVVAVGMNALASMSFGVLLASENSFAFAARGIGAHFTASVAASLCTLFAVVALQVCCLTILGPRLYSRVSPFLQALAMGGVVLQFLLLPDIASTARSFVEKGSALDAWITMAPPFWFLGLYEWILGTTDPVLLGARTAALTCLTAVCSGTALFYPAVYSRLSADFLTRSSPATWRRAVRAVGRITAPSHCTTRALIEFYLLTIARASPHRFVVACAGGCALAWCAAVMFAVGSHVDLIDVRVLSAVYASMVFILIGFRVAAALPVAESGAWVFDTSLDALSLGRSALERSMCFVVVFLSPCSQAFWCCWTLAVVRRSSMCPSYRLPGFCSCRLSFGASPAFPALESFGSVVSICVTPGRGGYSDSSRRPQAWRRRRHLYFGYRQRWATG